MASGKFHQVRPTRNNLFSRAVRLLGKAAALVAAFALLIGSAGNADSETSLPEYQVKALFLLNFAKYVDWPTDAFPQADTAMVIGILGESTIGDDLDNAAKGKNINGRKIVVQRIEKESEFGSCHILFIGVSEKKHLEEILAKTRQLPVLTVGETEQFVQRGGIINFIKKEGKVRLEINADSANKSRLQISSKLLNVADVVRGGQ